MRGHDGGVRSWGDVHVVSRVVGFKKIKFYTNENVGSGELDLPEQQMHTSSYWLTVPRGLYESLPWSRDDRRDGIAGLAYAMHSVAQLLLMCDRGDIGLSVTSGDDAADAQGPQGAERGVGAPRATGPGGVQGTPPGNNDNAPRVFIYDNYPGGIGFSEPLYLMHALLLERARDVIAECPCAHGCPSCVGPEGNQGPLAKAVALKLLDLMLAVEAAA
jgi:DEAD/DEAH box helicase domain-containing protein